MAAGENLGLVAVLRQQSDSLIDRLGSQVIKRCGNHDCLLYALIAFQIVSGLIGISRCFTPNGASASTIAPTIAGVAPIVPASPTPFTPSGFTGEGVSVRSSSNQGSCDALGTA